MFCQPLSGVSDHIAWTQLVNKEINERRKYTDQQYKYVKLQDRSIPLTTQKDDWRHSQSYSANKTTNFAPYHKIN